MQKIHLLLELILSLSKSVIKQSYYINIISQMDFDIYKEIGLNVIKVLGRGSYATVYYCTNQITTQPFAVKIFHKKDFTKQKLKSFRKQAQILASIQHKNVVKFISFKQTDSTIYLVMEYIPGGTLKSLINENNAKEKKFSDNQVSTLIKNILEGIQYLHKFNIIHRDLKPENILLADPGQLGSVKIVDFGLSAQIQMGSPTNVKSQCGTLLYMAPEILHQPSYSRAVDIWSCAIIMYILYTGKHPIYIEGMKVQQFKQKLKTCCFPQLPNSLANNFIKNLSKIEYTQRYSVNEALRHPWITRNEEDQIPLSVNQSIHSFDTSHLISDCLKFLLATHKCFPTKVEIPKEYIYKLKSFNQKHEQCRIRSPSYKKMRKTTNESPIKLSQIIASKQKCEERKDNQYLDLESPIIKKHQKLYLRLFEKNKQETIKFFNIEQCDHITKPEPEQQQQSQETPQIATIQLKPQEPINNYYEELNSPISISSHSISSARNTAPLTFYDVELPQIKINQKKQKFNSRIRKINSLRQDSMIKNQSNIIFLKGQGQDKLRQTFGSSKSKRTSNKVQPFSPQLLKSSTKRPQATQRGKTSSKTKDSRNMVFGLRVTHC